jgi:hypothetical protein
LTVSRPVGGVLSSFRRSLGDHPSSRPTWGLQLPKSLRGGPPMSHAWPCSEWGLPSRSGHPDRWCALTAPFHPYLCEPWSAIGGLLSVALSCGSPRLAVSQHPALRSPDLPQHDHTLRTTCPVPRPPSRLTVLPSVPGAGRVGPTPPDPWLVAAAVRESGPSPTLLPPGTKRSDPDPTRRRRIGCPIAADDARSALRKGRMVAVRGRRRPQIGEECRSGGAVPPG